MVFITTSYADSILTSCNTLVIAYPSLFSALEISTRSPKKIEVTFNRVSQPLRLPNKFGVYYLPTVALGGG